MTQTMTARRLCFDLLIKSEKGKQYSNIALDNALQTCALNDADKRLCSALFYGVIERKITLDYRISTLASRPLSEIDISVLTALRMGLYQLIYLDRIPAHAAINETVALVPKKLSGFVNAVLRSHTRASELVLPDKTDMANYLSVKYSIARPLVEKFISVFGDNAEAVVAGFEKAPETTLRVNTLKISRAELAENAAGATLNQAADTALTINGSVRDIYGYFDGLFFVQDVASQICVKAVGALPDETVLDICSCPGSKSFGMAIEMKNRGKILSFDLHENKLSLIRDGAKRLGIDIITAEAHDGRSFIPELEGGADRVLCDVPCSGFGVLAKKPELRYKSPAESERLPQIQLDILNNACRYVKHGGVLVYSTCTLMPEENEENIRRFLDEHDEFSLLPWSVGSINAEYGYLTLYPHIHGTDGFFIAKLIKA